MFMGILHICSCCCFLTNNELLEHCDKHIFPIKEVFHIDDNLWEC